MSERYVVGDWGTTHLRLYLIQGDQVLDVRDGVGIGRLTAPAAQVLGGIIAQWVELPPPIQVVLGGMASSRNGLQELPYLPAPADAPSWAGAARTVAVDSLTVLLSTGIQCGDDVRGFDVMRGEEAQIFGAMQLAPELLSLIHI